MEWFGNGVRKNYKSYITYEIDFLEILLDWKEKNENAKLEREYPDVRSDFYLDVYDKSIIMKL